MLGALLLTVFLASLPWAWINVSGTPYFAVRPAVISALPLALYFLLKCKYRIKPRHANNVGILFLIYLIWLIPCFYNQHPHWSVTKVLGLGIYTLLAFIAARVYLSLLLDDNWKKYWPLVSFIFLTSSILSFYLAFGSLIPNPNIENSTDFIYGTLYGKVFQDVESGKGIRHTMAIAVTVLMALIIHNTNCGRRSNIPIFLAAIYLVLFSFSRSAWLVAFLICLLVSRSLLKNLSKNIIRIYVGVMIAIITLPIVAIVFPEQLSWVWSILGDRLADDKSPAHRFLAINRLFTQTSFRELLLGYEGAVQYSPHNFILDAFMQSGLLGALGAIAITAYAIRTYLVGLLNGKYDQIVAAAFVTPALVRLFTAGSGMLHLSELFGLCVAANLGWYLKQQATTSFDYKYVASPRSSRRIFNKRQSDHETSH